MMFTDYSNIEISIFNNIKRYFEKLEAKGSKDYKNGFSDLVAQYVGGGETYVLTGDYYDELVINTVAVEIQILSQEEQSIFKSFYELEFMANYLVEDDYDYSEEDFAGEVFSRFKCWMDDNFSQDDLNEEDDEGEFDEDEDETDAKNEEPNAFNLTRGEEKISLIKNILTVLADKDFEKIQKRRLQLALIYLAYHPMPPDDDFVISVSFKWRNLYYKVEYSYQSIKLEQFFTEDGQCFYEYKYLEDLNDYFEEEGEFHLFSYVISDIIERVNVMDVSIRNEFI